MTKKEKAKLSQIERIEKYKNSFVLFKPIARLTKLTKEDRQLLKKQKQDRAKELVTVKKDFNMKKNAFEIRNWNVWFGSRHALIDVTTDIEKNKVTAVIGTNASGKTVLLRSLNRMNHIVSRNVSTSGNIYFYNGTNLYSPKIPQVELTTRVGLISQKPTPFPMSIYDNVAYGPKNHGITNKAVINKIVREALDDAALWDEVKDKLSAPASSLSGGQQQQLCIARAIALQPEVLLMDQPTTGLDPIATTFIENLILQLKQKFTIVMVTHSMNQAQRVSDNTLFMWKGQLLEQGSTRDIYTNPKHKRTKDYILGR